jgi:protein SCO1/2
MFRIVVLTFLLLINSCVTATETGEALSAVRDLGHLNGLALACRQPEASSRAKQLMIGHVPKLREWGEAYETATNAAYLTPRAQCPDAAVLKVQVEVLAVKLASLLPASPRPADVFLPEAGVQPRYLLEGSDGRAVMDSDFKGRFQLIAFGYTFCPDICPTTLVEMTHILKLLGESAVRVQPIFISVDPERDTPEQLKAYTGFFDPRILGLTGSPELVRRAADVFKVRYEKVQVPGASHYSMDHSAGMFLLGPDGAFVTKFAFGTDIQEVVRRIREFLAP